MYIYIHIHTRVFVHVYVYVKHTHRETDLSICTYACMQASIVCPTEKPDTYLTAAPCRVPRHCNQSSELAALRWTPQSAARLRVRCLSRREPGLRLRLRV